MKLFLANIIVFVITLVIMGVALGSVFFDMMLMSEDDAMAQDPAAMMESFASMAIPFLVAMLFIIPVAMMGWFAPALIVFHDVDIFTAFKMSFSACLKNFFPFLVYGIVLMVLFILGSLPLMLGLLVVMPMFYGSIYRSYRDIFVD